MMKRQPKHCPHLEQWPSTTEIMVGVIQCPYCKIQALEKLTDTLKKEIERINVSYHREAERLRHEYRQMTKDIELVNARNIDLSLFAAELCDSVDKREMLRKIDETVSQSGRLSCSG